ncbi:VOC family protein [Rhizorhabdus dicambivorans]|uniref:Lactoylglutathione lyase n=1 Tax=Rhizorhabdus dicambivorans TaxID=1850238 RepID=A0A2A4FU75_9SPHN|nr:VOC family protein [Rhizorhabdus dicambivorans]ATE67223.1 lactoylglutathione lyase [Rhizorhabdus dicambivorans]PCE41254.1 lactoylglutathione lyase [Rhizorhabdus dicambivorans]
MSKMIFVNLPVRHLAASIRFYEALGGTVNPQFSDERAASIMLSDTIFVMLLTHDRYAEFTKRPIGDARSESQMLIALNADSREAVDAAIEVTARAGGKADPNPAQEHGFMYGRSVEDPDGYVWEVFWMDMAAMDQAPAEA